MPGSTLKPDLTRTTSSRWFFVVFALGFSAAVFVLKVHSFLAVNLPVDADVLVIEGWMPSYALRPSVRELKANHYTHVFVPGLIFEKGDENAHYISDSARVAADLVELGVSASLIERCPIPPPGFNRTSHMARSVRDRMSALGVKARGITVLSLGSHARQSLLAYQRMLSAIAPVGIIAYPDESYDANRWWTSWRGLSKTTKNFAGWFKEVFVGLRS